MKNYRVDYKVDEDVHYLDFSMEGVIDDDTISISASDEIKSNHLGIEKDRFEIIDINETDVW